MKRQTVSLYISLLICRRRKGNHGFLFINDQCIHKIDYARTKSPCHLTVITFLYNKWTQDERMMRPYPMRMRQDSSAQWPWHQCTPEKLLFGDPTYLPRRSDEGIARSMIERWLWKSCERYPTHTDKQRWWCRKYSKMYVGGSVRCGKSKRPEGFRTSCVISGKHSNCWAAGPIAMTQNGLTFVCHSDLL